MAQFKLTPREVEVLYWVAHGRSMNDIGRRMGITISTVKNHLQNIYGKLNVYDRTSAVVKALKLGDLQLEDLQVDQPPWVVGRVLCTTRA